MICAIHQPQTFPWLGYIAKLLQADVFVLLDTVQFKKNEWQNRNKLKTPNGWQWLTVPVRHQFGQTIAQVEINTTANWRHKHLQTFKTYYARAPYFDAYLPELETLYAREWHFLAPFNIAGIQWILNQLEIDRKLVIASQLPSISNRQEITADERLVRIVRQMQADTYLSGAGAREYLNQALFPAKDIDLLFQNFVHPTYAQLHGEFVSHLSVLDLLFNHGPASKKIIQGGIR